MDAIEVLLAGCVVCGRGRRRRTKCRNPGMKVGEEYASSRRYA